MSLKNSVRSSVKLLNTLNTIVLSTAVAATFLAGQAKADAAADSATQAAGFFAKRDYSNSGAYSAQEAADLYAKAVAAATNTSDKVKYLVAESSSLYFVGDATAANDVKIDRFLKGENAADAATKLLGIADVATVTDAQLAQLKGKLSADDLKSLGDALYERGANLGQWGQANGVVQSLGKWAELRRNMEIIQVLGLTSTHSYGAFRILGRGYYKIPGLLGGDMTKATNYLQQAVKNTLVPGKKFSRDGYNNTYYAEVLNENGDTDLAKALLQQFIAADPAQIDSTSIPELKKAQSDAKDLLKTF